MNYVRRLLISKNDNFNQHFTSSHFFHNIIPASATRNEVVKKNHRYLKRDQLATETQVRRGLANEYFEYNIVFRAFPLQIFIVFYE